MKKNKEERPKVGDIKLSSDKDRKGYLIICVKAHTYDDGTFLSEWGDYGTHVKQEKTPKKENYIFDSDIRAINIGFIIPPLKQLMGAKSACTGKETTKIYINYVREAINLLEGAVKELEGIKENDYYENEERKN